MKFYLIILKNVEMFLKKLLEFLNIKQEKSKPKKEVDNFPDYPDINEKPKKPKPNKNAPTAEDFPDYPEPKPKAPTKRRKTVAVSEPDPEPIFKPHMDFATAFALVLLLIGVAAAIIVSCI